MRNQRTLSRQSARFRIKLAVGFLTAVSVLAASVAMAGPKGANVVRGDVSFSTQGNTTLIKASNNSIINYQQFNIFADETVRFIQPNARSRVLNRIRGAEPTRIDGTVQANGIVYFVNPAGVVFGKNSVVDVGGIYAAAANLSNRDFLRGVNRFTNAHGTVANEGTILGDAVYLIGRHVANYGHIDAEEGAVMLLSGKDVYIAERGGRMMVRLRGGAPADGKPGVVNTGKVNARGGSISLAAGDMYSLAVRNTGTLTAKNVAIDAGENGVAHVGGTIDATNPVGDGGRVVVLGKDITVSDALIDASGATGGGTVRIGGGFRGKGLPTAQRTIVTADSVIRADATGVGDGGTVVVWADGATGFAGEISAVGAGGGTGGFVEVSGKQALRFTGQVSAETLLLDPENINIVDEDGGGDDGELTDNDTILVGDGAGTDDWTISEETLEGINSAQIILEASDTITIEDLGDGELRMMATGSSGSTVTFRAGVAFTMDNTANLITTRGADLTIEEIAGGDGAIDITVGLIDTETAGFGDGTITLNAGTGTLTIVGAPNAGGADISLTAGTLNLGANTVFDDPVSLAGTINFGADATFTNTVSVAGTLDAAGFNVAFQDAVTLTGNTVITTTDGNATFSAGATVDGDFDLTFNLGTGTLEISEPIGGTTPINSLTVNGGGASQVVVSADIEADGNSMTFNVPYVLAADTTLTDTGNITFNSTVNTDGVDSWTLTVDADGATTFGGTVGNSGPLGALVTNAAGSLALNGGTIQTTNANADGGAVTFGEATVTLGAATVIDTDPAGAASDAGPISFASGSTVDNAWTLTLDATADGGGSKSTVALGTLGSGTPLAGVTVSASTLTLNGDISVDGGGDVDFQNVLDDTNLSGIVTLAGDVVIGTDANGGATGAGDILFANLVKIDGAQTMNLDASADGGGAGGTVNLGDVGTATQLTSLSVVGNVISLQQVRTTGALSVTSNTAITDNDTLTIGGTATFITLANAGANITLADVGSTFGAVTARTLNAGGTATVGGTIAITENAAMDLAQVDTAAGASFTTLIGGITDSGPLSISGAVTFTVADGQSVIVNTPTNVFGGAMTFASPGTVADVTVTDVTDIDLQAMTLAGNLVATSTTGNITDSGAATVGGTASFTTSTANKDITLTMLAVSGAIDVNTSGDTGDVAITNSTTVDLSASSVGGAMVVTAGGAGIINSGDVNVGGTATFTVPHAASVILDSAGNTFGSTVSFTSAGTIANVTIVDTTALALAGMAISGDLSATAGGALTDTGQLTVVGTGSFEVTSENDNIDLGTLDVVGAIDVTTMGATGDATLINTVTVDLAASNVGGTLNVSTAGDLGVSGAVTAGTQITLAAGTDGTGAIDGPGLLTAPTIDLDAATGIGATTAVATATQSLTADTVGGDIDVNNASAAAVTIASATTGTGGVLLSQTGGGALAVTTVTTTDGTIGIDVAGGDLAATTVTAGGANNVTLTTTASGDIMLGAIDAAGDQITVNSAGGIEELGADAGAELTATTLDLDAVSGIGAAGTLETAGTAVAADTTNGAIDLDNASAGSVTVSSATTGIGGILLSQSGGGKLTVMAATTADGAIGIDVAAADLSVTTVTAGGAGNDVLLATTGSGDIAAGAVTAAADQIMVSSAGAIDGPGTLTASTVDLDAVTGIGAGTTVATATQSLTADTTNGAIDVDNTSAAAVVVGTITTGTGGVLLSQAGGGTLSVTMATTTDGAIGIDVAGADLEAGAVTAGGAGNDITLTTTGSGNVLVDAATAIDDVIAITSAGSIEELAGDGDADLTAATLDLDAVTGIGAVAALEIAASAGLSADTTNGEIDLANSSTAAVTASSLTTGTGGISLIQSGGGKLSVTLATTADGAIVLAADAADLEATTVTAGGASNVSLTTTGATGDVLVDAIDATGDQITVTSVGGIEELGAGDVGVDFTATTLNLSGVTAIGVGAAGALETACSTLGLNTTGAANINNSLAVDLAASNVGGALGLVTGGGITDSGNVIVGGNATFAVPDAVSIILDSVGNTFGGTVAFNSAGTIVNVTIVDTTALDLAALTISGNLSATAGGALTDSGLLTVGGTASFTVTTANDNIDLDTLAVIGAVDLNTVGGTGDAAIANTVAVDLAASGVGGQLTINSGGAVDIAASTVGGALIVNAGGDITDSGNLSVGGTSTFDVPDAASVTLDSAGNVFTGTVAFTSAGTIANVTIVDTTALDLAALAISGDLSVTAGGDLTDSGLLTVGGTGSFTVTTANDDVNLGTLAVTGAIDVTTTGLTGDATLVNTVTVDLAASNVGGTLNVSSADDVGVSGAVTAGTQITLAAGTDGTGAIDGPGLLTAPTIDLDAATGIGATTAMATATQALTADTIGGDIDIDNTSAAAVTIASATTGTGGVLLSQAGGGNLAVTTVTTTDGAIGIDVASGDLAATTVTAGGANNVTLTTTASGDIALAAIDAAGDQITVNSAGAIEELGPDAGIDLTATTLDLDAITGIGGADALESAGTAIWADTTGGSVDLDNASAADATVHSATTGTGGVLLSQSGGGALSVTAATTTDGSIGIDVAAADLEATTVTAGGAGNDVTLTTTGSGNVLVDAVSAVDDAIAIASAGSIEELGAGDAGADLTAATLDLDAVTGIGASAALEIAATTSLAADTTNGAIDLDNTSASAVTVSSLTTGTGGILLSQSGGGKLTVTTATTTSGAIGVDVAAADLEATTVTTGGAADTVTLTTTGSGDVTIDAITGGAAITINSAGGIEESGAGDAGTDLTAATLDLDAVAGIGASGALETVTAGLAADTTDGAIDLANTSVADVTASSVTTGTGDITLTQAGGGKLSVTLATTADGAIALTADAADLEATTVTAAGANDVTLTTTGAAGDVLIDVITAGSDTITVTSVGAIEELAAGDPGVDLAAATLDLDAATGIGAAGGLETAAAAMTIDSITGDVSVANTSGVDVAVATVTTGTGDILLDQVGGGRLTIGTAATTDGSIGLSNDSDDLTATIVTAGGTGSVSLTTTTAGNIAVLTELTGVDLRVSSAGGAVFNGVANDVDGFAAIVGPGADLSLIDLDDVMITTLDGISGLTTLGGDISIDAGGDVTGVAGAPISTSTAGAAGGDVTITTSSGDVVLASGVDTTGANNLAGAGFDGGDVTITNGDGSVSVVAINASGGDANGGDNDGGAAGSVTIDVDGGDIVVGGDQAALGGAPAGLGVAGDPGAISYQPDDGVEDRVYTYPGAGPLTETYVNPLGVVVFENDPVISGGDVAFAGVGRIETPGVATMSAPNGLTVDAVNFTMGEFEKLTVGRQNGTALVSANVSITVTGVAVLSDITSTGNITIKGTGGGAQLQFIRREPAEQLTADGPLQVDTGLDFASDGRISITGLTVVAPVNPGSPAPLFSMRIDGAVPGAADQKLLVTSPMAKIYADADVTNPARTPLVLDAAAQGTVLPNVATSLAGVLPSPWRDLNVSADATVGEALKKQLLELGIFAREVRPSERLQWVLTHIVKHVDYVGPKPAVEGEIQEYQVSVGRLHRALASKAVAQYKRLFFVADEYRVGQVLEPIQAGLNAFAEQGGPEKFDAVKFAGYVGSAEGHAKAGQTLAEVQAMFATIKLLGLTDVELRISRDVLLEDFILTYRGKELVPSQVDAMIALWNKAALLAAK